MSVDDNVMTAPAAGDEVEFVPDAAVLRAQVRDKCRQVAADPGGSYHFYTGRALAARLGYDPAIVDGLPDRAVESFAGVGNPFSLRRLEPGERVVDIGSGAGFDSFVAADHVGPTGRVVGVDMTAEMLDKSRQTAAVLGFDHVEFREGLAEAVPVEDGWADVVISKWGDQFVRRHAGRVCRDAPCPATRRLAAVRRYRQRSPSPTAMRDVDLWTG